MNAPLQDPEIPHRSFHLTPSSGSSPLSNPSPRTSLGVKIVFCVFTIPIFTCIILALIPDSLYTIVFGLTPKLLLGWLTYPGTNLPPAGHLVALAFMFLILAPAFFTAGRFVLRKISVPGNPPLPFPLRTRFSLMALSATIALITLILALATQNLIDLLNPASPILQSSIKPMSAETAFNNATQMIIARLEQSADPQKARHASRSWEIPDIFLPRHFEQIQFGFISRPDGSLYAGYACPYDPAQRAALGIIVVTLDSMASPDAYDPNQHLKNLEQWPQLLKTLQQQARQQKAVTPPTTQSAPEATP